MNIAVELEPSGSAPPGVEYRWDPDTDILSAQVHPPVDGGGMSGSVEVEGTDGSWLILDVSHGRISGVEVAVWPEVHTLPSLSPPNTVEDAAVLLPSPASQAGISALEVETLLVAESDDRQRTIHFRLGPARQARTARVGRDLLIDVDGRGHIAGVWLLNVPPYPGNAG